MYMPMLDSEIVGRAIAFFRKEKGLCGAAAASATHPFSLTLKETKASTLDTLRMCDKGQQRLLHRPWITNISGFEDRRASIIMT